MFTNTKLHCVVVVTFTSLLHSCCVTPEDKSAQLARVAKDWCLTIRASQILPVYPLTQDLRPGDLFLTTTPIGEEIALFESKGFLPLDLHLKRLPLDVELAQFYATRLDGQGFPAAATSWTGLPGSAFPTYKFEMSRSGGVNLAVPVEGVPIALGYLGSSSAVGSLTLKKTDTAGLDIATLKEPMDNWAAANRSLLGAYAMDPLSRHGVPVFVRVVSRVYRAGGVTMLLSDAAASGVEIAAGLALPTPASGAPSAAKAAAEQYDEIATSLNTTLTQQVGVRARVVSVAQHSVTMNEDFSTPMVVGYLAYDCQILSGGYLSAPVPSFQRLSGSSVAIPGAINSASVAAGWVADDEANRVLRVKEWMDKHLPAPPGGPKAVEFMSLPKWDAERRLMLREFGVLPSTDQPNSKEELP